MSARRGLVVPILLALVSGCGGSAPQRDAPPATGAARLVPADALVYVHLSTDARRPATQRALKLARRFPSFGLLRDLVLAPLAGGNVSGWIGSDAALALLTPARGQRAAGSLVLLAVRDRGRAEAALGPQTAPPLAYGGAQLETHGRRLAAFVGDYLAIGSPASLRAAIDLAGGRGRSLAGDPLYQSAVAPLPDGRVADAYATAIGVRGALEPQPGVFGAAARLLDQPALRGVALALSAVRGGAALRVHSVLDPGRRTGAGSPLAPFTPTLARSVPASAIGYLGVRGITRALAPLLQARVGPSSFFARVQQLLGAPGAARVAAGLVPLLGQEVAVWLGRHVPLPTLSVVANAPEPRATAASMSALEAPLVKLLAPSGGFRTRELGGVSVRELPLANGLVFAYAVTHKQLVISSSSDAIAEQARHDGSLAGRADYAASVAQRPKAATSVLFLDFSQLLQLGEQTGLGESPTYSRIRNDLALVRAVGERSWGGEGDTNAELSFRIP